MDDVAIKVENVSKRFILPHERANSVKGLFLNPFRSKLKNSKETQHALKDVSFEIKKGEFFGIVGRNGSGKSTLLKILAGIYQPNSGKVTINGRLVPFIELGVGFNPELTGRENVYLNGALLGFSQKEIDRKYSKIVDFAELERFMDQHLKNYSSGMQVRLAFSVATILAESEILLIDEVLAVGDADFQRKCFDYFNLLKKQHKTVVFVSHDMNAVRQFCDRAVLVNDGTIERWGSTEEVARAYTELFVSQDEEVEEHKGTRWGEDTGVIKSIKLKRTLETITIVGKLSSTVPYVKPIFGYSIKNIADLNIMGVNNRMLNKVLPDVNQDPVNFSITLPNILSDGTYLVDLALLAEDGLTVIDWWSESLSFINKKHYTSPYPVSPETEMSFTKRSQDV